MSRRFRAALPKRVMTQWTGIRPGAARATVVGLGVALSLLAGGVVTSSAAQDVAPGHACVGTWLLRVTSLAQPDSAGFPVNATFHTDGTFITEGAPVHAGPPDAPENVTIMSTAQGVWQPTETGGCAVTHVFYNSDLKGNLASAVEIRIVLVPGPDGTTMTTQGTDYATVTAPDGTVLFAGPGNTVKGTRLTVKLAPSVSPSPAP